MTTFDKLKGAAATLADAAVKTTGDLAQKGKKQMDLLALENKLSQAPSASLALWCMRCTKTARKTRRW